MSLHYFSLQNNELVKYEFGWNGATHYLKRNDKHYAHIVIVRGELIDFDTVEELSYHAVCILRMKGIEVPVQTMLAPRERIV